MLGNKRVPAYTAWTSHTYMKETVYPGTQPGHCCKSHLVTRKPCRAAHTVGANRTWWTSGV